MLKTIALGFAALTLAAAETFTGTVTDNMCAQDHSKMKMGPDPKCVTECVKTMNAKYALYDGKTAYILSDQKTPAKFAGQKVTVTGTLNGKTLKVDQIAPAK
jgi:hypothetical protein